MIITRLEGGLGNQMFQYACGRMLSVQLGVPLLLETSFYEEVRNRSFSLNQFDIQARIAMEEELNSVLSPLQRALDLLRIHKHIVTEKSQRFDPRVLLTPDNSYLDGYWQCEKYFLPITSKLLGEFGLRVPFSSFAADYARLIGDSDSVAIHIRRDDYITNPKFAAVHGIMPLSYYEDAMKIIEQKVENPRYFLFSDDPAWAEKNLKARFKVDLVSGSRATDGEELHLMALCRHHIIANSSFSWWGAWLDQRLEKIVVAPKNWFKSARFDTSDLMPESWIKI